MLHLFVKLTSLYLSIQTQQHHLTHQFHSLFVLKVFLCLLKTTLFIQVSFRCFSLSTKFQFCLLFINQAFHLFTLQASGFKVSSLLTIKLIVLFTLLLISYGQQIPLFFNKISCRLPYTNCTTYHCLKHTLNSYSLSLDLQQQYTRFLALLTLVKAQILQF